MFDQWMKLYRFKHSRSFVTSIWEDENMKATDPSYIARKPENLGKFFLFVDCCVITLSTNHFV
jgi:hypothetical protein